MRDEMTARQAREGRSEAYLLTIAVGVAPSKRVNLELPQIAAPLDWINLMTYDFHGAWESRTGHNAALAAQGADPSTDREVREEWNVSSAVDGFLDAGVAGSQLVLGVPFYGRSFAGVTGGTNGLFGTATGPGPGTWETGVVEWADVRDNYLTDPAWVRHWDAGPGALALQREQPRVHQLRRPGIARAQARLRAATRALRRDDLGDEQ